MITIKSDKDIECLRQAGKVLAQALEEVLGHVRPGVSTLELDRIAESALIKNRAKPSFKGYRSSKDEPPYPTTLCTSVNEEVVHTPASERILKSGDIVGVDIGLKFHANERDYFVDMAKTVGVGEISSEVKKLLQVTEDALSLAIKTVKPGRYISDIGKTVQKFVESQGFSVVRSLVGHGVGYAVHEEPKVPNFFSLNAPRIEIKKGIVLALEPMVNMGGFEVETKDDGWTVITRDRSLSAHFEHTVAVTEKGCKILTQ